MLTYPPFPSQSAMGSFPAFPTISYQIPNMLDFPSYIAAIVPYYADVINYPYSNPPKLGTWTIGIPNLLAIPNWIAQIVMWVAGWLGAVLKYGIIYVLYFIGNGILYLINLGAGTFTAVITATQSLAKPLGIFAIPVEMGIAGLLIVALITIAWGTIKAIQTVIEMIP